MSQCKICSQYHKDKHPFKVLQEKFRDNAKRLNKTLTKEKRSEAAKKGWLNKSI